MTVSSWGVTIIPTSLKTVESQRKINHDKNRQKPTVVTIILRNRERLTMNTEAFLGFSFMTDDEGGIVDKAKEAKVSIIKLIHKICVTVNGISVPIKEPASVMISAVKLMVSWKPMKRWIFL